MDADERGQVGGYHGTRARAVLASPMLKNGEETGGNCNNKWTTESATCGKATQLDTDSTE
jgi:hypothetical protein